MFKMCLLHVFWLVSSLYADDSLPKDFSRFDAILSVEEFKQSEVKNPFILKLDLSKATSVDIGFIGKDETVIVRENLKLDSEFRQKTGQFLTRGNQFIELRSLHGPVYCVLLDDSENVVIAVEAYLSQGIFVPLSVVPKSDHYELKEIIYPSVDGAIFSEQQKKIIQYYKRFIVDKKFAAEISRLWGGRTEKDRRD